MTVLRSRIRTLLRLALPLLAIGVIVGLAIQCMVPNFAGPSVPIHHRSIYGGQAYSYRYLQDYQGWHEESSFFPFLSTLFAILTALIGFLLLRLSNGRKSLKYLGSGLLLVVGLCVIHFNVFLIALLCAAWFFCKKGSEYKQQKRYYSTTDIDETIVASYDIEQFNSIDEWEDQVRKQQK